MQIFRVKPLAAVALEGVSDGQSLKRVLGAGDLIMLAIGAVIGAGIFGAIGTAAAGQVGPNGEVIIRRSGARVVLPDAGRRLRLCRALLCGTGRHDSPGRQRCTFATLGELVAWIIGWDLILEYAVGNIAVAISWSDYFMSLMRGIGLDLPAWLTTGYRTVTQSSVPAVQALWDTAPRLAGDPNPRQSAGLRHRDGRDVAAAARREGDIASTT